MGLPLSSYLMNSTIGKLGGIPGQWLEDKPKNPFSPFTSLSHIMLASAQ